MRTNVRVTYIDTRWRDTYVKSTITQVNTLNPLQLGGERSQPPLKSPQRASLIAGDVLRMDGGDRSEPPVLSIIRQYLWTPHNEDTHVH